MCGVRINGVCDYALWYSGMAPAALIAALLLSLIRCSLQGTFLIVLLLAVLLGTESVVEHVEFLLAGFQCVPSLILTETVERK